MANCASVWQDHRATSNMFTRSIDSVLNIPTFQRSNPVGRKTLRQNPQKKSLPIRPNSTEEPSMTNVERPRATFGAGLRTQTPTALTGAHRIGKHTRSPLYRQAKKTQQSRPEPKRVASSQHIAATGQLSFRVSCSKRAEAVVLLNSAICNCQLVSLASYLRAVSSMLLMPNGSRPNARPPLGDSPSVPHWPLAVRRSFSSCSALTSRMIQYDYEIGAALGACIDLPINQNPTNINIIL